MSSCLVGAKLCPEDRTKNSFMCGSKPWEVCLNVNDLLLPAQLQVKLILLTTNLMVMRSAYFII